MTTLVVQTMFLITLLFAMAVVPHAMLVQEVKSGVLVSGDQIQAAVQDPAADGTCTEIEAADADACAAVTALADTTACIAVMTAGNVAACTYSAAAAAAAAAATTPMPVPATTTTTTTTMPAACLMICKKGQHIYDVADVACATPGALVYVDDIVGDIETEATVKGANEISVNATHTTYKMAKDTLFTATQNKATTDAGLETARKALQATRAFIHNETKANETLYDDYYNKSVGPHGFSVADPTLPATTDSSLSSTQAQIAEKNFEHERDRLAEVIGIWKDWETQNNASFNTASQSAATNTEVLTNATTARNKAKAAYESAVDDWHHNTTLWLELSQKLVQQRQLCKNALDSEVTYAQQAGGALMSKAETAAQVEADANWTISDYVKQLADAEQHAQETQANLTALLNNAKYNLGNKTLELTSARQAASGLNDTANEWREKRDDAQRKLTTAQDEIKKHEDHGTLHVHSSNRASVTATR